MAGKAGGNMIAGEGKNRGETPSLERLDQEALPHPTVDCTKLSVLLLFVYCLPTSIIYDMKPKSRVIVIRRGFSPVAFGSGTEAAEAIQRMRECLGRNRLAASRRGCSCSENVIRRERGNKVCDCLCKLG